MIPSRSSSLKRQFSSGIAWTATGRTSQQMIQLGFSIVLARLLSPHDYGLLAMVSVFTGFAWMLADFGFSVALVQRQELTDAHIHSVFWIDAAFGWLLAAVSWLAAPWVAKFYSIPDLDPIFRWSSLNFIIGSFGNVPFALLQKRLDFKSIAKADTISIAGSGIVCLVLSLMGKGAWSLVIQMLVSTTLTSALRLRYSRWLPRMTFSFVAIKELWRFTFPFYGFQFINYWSRNGDNLLVGKFFGAPVLGVYNRAYALMLLPITQVTNVISQVVFPTFSSLQNDKPKVKRIYLRSISVVALITFPAMMALVVLAKPFVETVYGPKWTGVIPLLQIFGLLGILQVLVHSTGWIFIPQGRTDIMFWWGLRFAAAVFLSFAAGIVLGSATALACCYAVVNLIFFYPRLRAAGRIIDMRVSEVLTAVAGPFCGGLVMSVCIFIAGFLLPAHWKKWEVLFTLSAFGLAIYAAFVVSFRLQAWREVVTLIVEKCAPHPELEPLPRSS